MSMNWDALAEATLSTVGVVQGLYMRFLDENRDEEIALRLTEIAWNGIMLGMGDFREDDLP